MAFKDSKQRAFYFANKNKMGGSPMGNPTNPAVGTMNVQPSNTPPAQPTIQPVKIPGLPKSAHFGRIRRYFKV